MNDRERIKAFEREWERHRRRNIQLQRIVDSTMAVLAVVAFAGALAWHASSTLLKPTLSEIEARRADVEAAIEVDRRQSVWRDELLARDDKLQLALEVLTDAVRDMQGRVPGVPRRVRPRVPRGVVPRSQRPRRA